MKKWGWWKKFLFCFVLQFICCSLIPLNYAVVQTLGENHLIILKSFIKFKYETLNPILCLMHHLVKLCQSLLILHFFIILLWVSFLADHHEFLSCWSGQKQPLCLSLGKKNKQCNLKSSYCVCLKFNSLVLYLLTYKCNF